MIFLADMFLYKKLLITVILFSIYSLCCKASDFEAGLYINNKPVNVEIFFPDTYIPFLSLKDISPLLNLDFTYNAEGDNLFFGDRLFPGRKVFKNSEVFVSIEDFASFFIMDYRYDSKAGTIDLRSFSVRLQEKEDGVISSGDPAILQEKTGKELEIIYERSESKEDNTFSVYGTVWNNSETILDRVVITCSFSLPTGEIISQQKVDLNTLNPGDWREITFSVPKPAAGMAGGSSLYYNRVTTPDGGVYSSAGFNGGPVAPQPLITPDYRLEADYQVRKP